MGLRADLLRAVLEDLPDPTSVLTEPDPRWDALLGGRTGKDSWGRYGRGAGTTCIIALDGWALKAGFPADMVVGEPTPSGGGTRIITAFNKGAQQRGWLRTPARGQLPALRPGDVYETNHAATLHGQPVDGTHVGVVVSATPSADGQSLVVETADGGQGTLAAQKASRQVRVFSLSSGAHPVTFRTVQAQGSPSGTPDATWRALGSYPEGWLDRWVAVGSDVADDVAAAPASTGPATGPAATPDASEGGGGEEGVGVDWLPVVAGSVFAALGIGLVVFTVSGKPWGTPPAAPVALAGKPRRVAFAGAADTRGPGRSLRPGESYGWPPVPHENRLEHLWETLEYEAEGARGEARRLAAMGYLDTADRWRRKAQAIEIEIAEVLAKHDAWLKRQAENAERGR